MKYYYVAYMIYSPSSTYGELGGWLYYSDVTDVFPLEFAKQERRNLNLSKGDFIINNFIEITKEQFLKECE